MQSPARDVAQVRLDNALALFDEFVRNTVKDPDVATLRGLERRFAERLQIQPSYWSQIKSRSRQIGERLARQFEQLCHKPPLWMDVPHDLGAAGGARPAGAASRSTATSPQPAQDAPAGAPMPQDDDERFIVGLVLTYYRRHPQRARTRLLDLLGEVLMPEAPAGPTMSTKPPAPAKSAPPAGATARPSPTPSPDDPHSLWQRSQAGVAPLKRKS